MYSANIQKNYIISSPIGDLKLSVSDLGLHSLKLSRVNLDFCPNISTSVKIIENDSFPNESVRKHVLDCLNWLSNYFTDSRSVCAIPLPCLCHMSESGSFREKVWLALAKNVVPGQTISYQGLAKLVNSPGAARAVGTAMATNPVMIIVPCHRVVKSGGKIGNYGGGISLKKWLLNHEKAAVKNDYFVLSDYC